MKTATIITMLVIAFLSAMGAIGANEPDKRKNGLIVAIGSITATVTIIVL